MFDFIPEILARQSNSTLVVGAIGSAITAAWLAYRSYNQYHAAHTIENIPTAKARSAHQGYVELTGKARAMDENSVVSPVSGTQCIWYRYTVETKVQRSIDGVTQQGWQKYRSGESQLNLFWVEDDTGRVLVDPENAAVSTTRKYTWYANHMAVANGGGLAEFIEGAALTNSQNSRYKLTEERIHEGELIYAIGQLHSVHGHETGPSINDDLRNKLADWKLDQTTLLERFDLDSDGEIDQQEWELARSAARREVKKERATMATSIDHELNLLQAPNDSRRPFIVSTHSQQRLIKQLKKQALLSAAGFFALGSATTYLCGFIR